MVSIKSLAVLLFAAAVTAAPFAGDKKDVGHNVNNVDFDDSSIKCGNGQEIHCCNDDVSSKDAGLLSFLNGAQVKCNNLGLGVLGAGNALSPTKQCESTVACCSKKTDQTGIVNVDADLSCSLPGVN